MKEKLYNTYMVGDKATLIELDKKVIKGKEYMLLVQKEDPSLVCVGYFEGEELKIVTNRTLNAELLKTFMLDKNLIKKI